MRKRIFSILLTIAVCLSMMPAGVWAADGETSGQGTNSEHSHCICGGNTNVNGHSHSTDLDFKPWTEIDKLPNEGTYYLTESVTISGKWSPTGEVKLCLNGKTISGSITVGTGATLTLTDCTNKGRIQGNNNSTGVTVNGGTFNMYGGTLTVADTVTKIIGSVASEYGQRAAIEATGGVLDLQGNTLLDGGLTMSGDAQLKNKLTAGTFTNSGSEAYSVSVEGSSQYTTVFDLLETGYAFAEYDADNEGDTTGAVIVKDDRKSLTEDVIVVAHTHSPKCTQNPDPDALQTYIYICDCGFVCPHDRFTNSICDICHAACTHDEYTSDDKCARCGAPFAVRVEHTDGVGLTSNKLYMKTTAQDGTDDTLRQVFNEAADGSTITLLANGMLPDGIYASKTLTLDLNGHSLSGYSLNVGGLTPTSQVRTGNLTVIDSSGGNGAVGVTVRNGGTLVFDPKNDSTTLLQLEVWGGTVELYGGKISRNGLRLNNSITLGNLLPQKAGLAYYCGDTQLTLEEAASKTCDLVVKSCSHGGKNGFDKNATTCPYCNAPAVAETALNNGDGNRPQRRFADLQTALDADRDGGAELTLLADVTGDYTIDGTQNTGLNLNGHSIKGTVTVKAAVGNNTTTFSNTKNTTTVSIDKVVACKGAKLAGSGNPAMIGTLTLADTTKWNDILQQPIRLGFKVTSVDGTYKWYAPNDVKDSQLNNVIINSLPITSKTLNLKVNGTNLTGNPPKVERGTTVQLCASCNAKGADVYIYTGKIDGNNVPTYSQKKAEYKKIGTSWYYVVDLTANTIGTYDIYFTATKDGYSVTSSHKKLTVTKATIPASAITAPAANALTYNGNEQALITAGSVTNYGTMQYSLTKNGTYSQDIPTGTDAGAYTVWYRVIGDANHNDTAPASVAVRIGKKPLTITGVTAASKPYDGTTNADISSVTFDNVTLNRGTDYTVTANFDDASVGNGKNVTATVTLTEQTAKNYALEQSSFPTTGNIIKAAAPDFTKETALTIVNGHEKTYTVTLPALPTLETPKEYGALTYEIGEIKLNDGYYTSGAKVENGKLTLPIQKNDVETTGSVGTVTVVIKSANYEDITLTVNVNATNKLVPTATAPTANALTYNGAEQALVTAGKTTGGTMLYQLGDSEWSEQIPTAKNAGEYTVWYKVQGNAEYADVAEQNVPVTVAKKAVTVTALDQSAYTGSTAPDLSSPKADKNYKVEGLVGADNLSGMVTLAYKQTPDMSKTGKTAINITGTLSNDNYEITYVPGTLTVSNQPSGGGGGIVIPVQKPEITTGDGGKTDLSDDGTTIKITPDEGKEVDKVLVNGKDIGAVTEVKDLKPGDKVEVIFKDKVKEPTKEELDSKVKAALNDMTLKARSAKTSKKNIRINVIASITDKLPDGYTVKYKYYRSTKKTSGYRLMTAKSENYYINTKGTKGTRYYYKARVAVYDNDGKLIAQTELKQCKYAARVWTKLSKSK